jgi:mannose-6-phosphate isomerase-like protein (cupin superfamily)
MMTATAQGTHADKVHVTDEELAQRTIRRTALVPCDQAFIDYRTPGSDRKQNYALIGPGVSQSADQFVNLQIPHGYNVGGVAMPNGVTNSLHLHFTAEVFVVITGAYEFRWGPDGSGGPFVARAGDVISVPTWIFRGFTNVGPDENFMFTVLGQDDTGGIIWGPAVLREAERHGLYLSAGNLLIDTTSEDSLEGVELIKPMPDEQIARLRSYTPEQMRQRVTTDADREFFGDALLCTAADGGAVELALVIGFGMTEHRYQEPRVRNPHGFNLAWLRAPSGHGMLRHRHDASQVLIARSGEWEVTLNEDDPVSVRLGPSDALSVPHGAWRQFTNVSADTAEMIVINGGDGRVRLQWSPSVVAAARKQDVGYDANGYLAPWSLVSHAAADD